MGKKQRAMDALWWVRLFLYVLLLIATVAALLLRLDIKCGKEAEEAWYADGEDWDDEEDWAD